VIRDWHKRLVNVHIEDMRAGVHEHLMFGEGEMDFPPIIAALAEIRYDGGVHIELSRHSHDGAAAAKRAYDFLHPLIAVSEL
jgi:L-ribulose-5-phosphate 3-epimerase